MNIYCPAAWVYLAPHEYQVSVRPSTPPCVACTGALLTECVSLLNLSYESPSSCLLSFLDTLLRACVDCSQLFSLLVYGQLWGQAQPQYLTGAGAGVVGVGALTWVT